MSLKHTYNVTLKKIPLREKERNKRPRLSCDVVHHHVSRFQMAPEGNLAHALHSILQSSHGQRRSITFPKGIKSMPLLPWRKTGWEKHV